MPGRHAASRFPPLPRNPTHVPPPILWDRNAHDAAYGASCENFLLPKPPDCGMMQKEVCPPCAWRANSRDLPRGPGAGRRPESRRTLCRPGRTGTRLAGLTSRSRADPPPSGQDGGPYSGRPDSAPAQKSRTLKPPRPETAAGACFVIDARGPLCAQRGPWTAENWKE